METKITWSKICAICGNVTTKDGILICKLGKELRKYSCIDRS
jgi:hypothetical protein